MLPFIYIVCLITCELRLLMLEFHCQVACKTAEAQSVKYNTGQSLNGVKGGLSKAENCEFKIRAIKSGCINYGTSFREVRQVEVGNAVSARGMVYR